MHDQSDNIADSLDRLHAGGWSIGGAVFHDIETGTNGENMIRAEGATGAEAWRRALD
jgi:hypothetical protein